MAFSLEQLAVRLSNQLVSTMEERDALRTKVQLISNQASAAQADNVSLTRRLFRNASNGVRHESELRLAANENRCLEEKLRSAASSARALRLAISPEGRLASLFDQMFDQLDDVDTSEESQQDLSTNTSIPTERESRRRKRASCPSPVLEKKRGDVTQ